MLTGDTLRTIHSEIQEMFTELNRGRNVAMAIDRLAVTDPTLPGRIAAELRAMAEEQVPRDPTPAPKRKR